VNFYGITDLTTFVLGTIFIVLLPGPNSLYVMTVASRRGHRLGYHAAIGIVVADTVLMLLAATGMASLLQASSTIYLTMKFIGAAYLAWLGAQLMHDGIAHWRHWPAWQQGPDQAAERRPDRKRLDLSRPFRTAVMIGLLNPKAIMFFVSFFIQFVDPAYGYPALSFVILGVIVQIFSVMYLIALIVGGARLSQRFGQRRWLPAISIAGTGLLFIGFAAKLAL